MGTIKFVDNKLQHHQIYEQYGLDEKSKREYEKEDFRIRIDVLINFLPQVKVINRKIM